MCAASEAIFIHRALITFRHQQKEIVQCQIDFCFGIDTPTSKHCSTNKLNKCIADHHNRHMKFYQVGQIRQQLPTTYSKFPALVIFVLDHSNIFLRSFQPKCEMVIQNETVSLSPVTSTATCLLPIAQN